MFSEAVSPVGSTHKNWNAEHTPSVAYNLELLTKCLGLSIGRLFPVLETLNTAHNFTVGEEAASQTRAGCLLACVYTWDEESFSADLLRTC